MKPYAWEKETTRKSLSEQVFFLQAGLLVVYQLAVFLALSFLNADTGVALAAIFGSGTFFLLAGLRDFGPAPVRGGVLVAGGVIPSILSYWLILPSVIGVAVATYALLSISSRTKKLQLEKTTTPLADGIHPPL